MTELGAAAFKIFLNFGEAAAGEPVERCEKLRERFRMNA